MESVESDGDDGDDDGDDGGEHQQTFVPGAQPQESSGGVRARRLHLGTLTTGPTASRAYNGALTSWMSSGSPADMVHSTDRLDNSG